MRVLLLFGARWQAGWGRSQNLAKALARDGHQVLYVNQIGRLSPARVLSLVRPIAAQRGGVHLHPETPGLPFTRFPSLTWPAVILQIVYLWRLALRRKSFDLVIHYGVPPRRLQRYLRWLLRDAVQIYDCADDKVATFRDLVSEASSRRIRAWESHLVSTVDGVTAINAHNLRRLGVADQARACAIGNGVDLEIFRQIPGVGPPDAPPFRGIYVGAINDRLDIARIERLLEKSGSELELHFYGNEHPVIDRLSRHRGFRYHGFVPYEQLARYLCGAHFGLLPYRDLESIQRSFPLKTLQYLACGLPVLAFEYQGLATFGGRVTLIGDTLPCEALLERRDHSELLRDHTWSVMARQLVDFCKSLRDRSRPSA